MDRPARLAFGCLLALAALVPLMPIGGHWLPGKPPAALLIALLGAAGLAVDAWRGAKRSGLGTPLDLAVLAFLGLAGLSVVASRQPALARYELIRLITLGLVYLLAVRTLNTPGRVRALLLTALGSGTVVSVFGLLAHQDFVASGAPESARAMLLSTPFFGHAYLVAQYVVPSLVAALILLFERGRSLPARLLLLLLALPVAGFVIVSGSRGAVLAIAAALFLSALLRATALSQGRPAAGQVLKLAGKGLLAAAGVALLIVLASITGLLEDAPALLGRLSVLLDTSQAETTFSRLRVWEAGLAMAGDHLVLGTGPAGFGALLPTYMPSPIVVPHAHNQFVQVLVEHGLPGLIALLLLIRAARHVAVRGAVLLESDGARRALFHALAAALTAALVYGFFETPLIWTESGVLIVALLAALGRAGCVSRDKAVAREGILSSAGLLVLLLGVGATDFVRNVPTISQSSHALELMQAAERSAREDRQAAKAQMQLALDLTTNAEIRFPHHARVAELGSRLCSRLGRFEEALEWRKLANKRLPNAYKHLRELGQLYLLTDRPAQAIEPLRRALAAHRGIAAGPTYQLLANAYARAGLDEQASFCFGNLRRALWHHGHPEMLLPAAGSLIRLGRELDQAETLLAEFVERMPREAQANAEILDELTARIVELRARRPREGRHFREGVELAGFGSDAEDLTLPDDPGEG